MEGPPVSDLSTQVLLMNILPVLDRAGVEEEIIWHLTSIKMRQIGKGALTSEYLEFPLPEIRVAWRQNKQGKSKNKAEKDLPLNKLSAFQKHRCLVCIAEAVEGSWPRLGPL